LLISANFLAPGSGSVWYSRPATLLTAVIAGEETQRIVVRQTQSAIEKLERYILLLIVYPSGPDPS
jgi:hypothetical protein